MKLAKKYFMFGYPDGRVSYFTSKSHARYIQRKYTIGSLYECTFSELKQNIRMLRECTNAFIFQKRC